MLVSETDQHVEPDDEAFGPQGGSAESADGGLTTADARILVVEDDEDLRAILVKFLVAAGHTVVEAADGRQGLRMLHEHRPDLVVLDLMMPNLDGWAALERMRDVSDIPILILSALASEQDKVRCLLAGADDYVMKPFGRDEVLARVAALMRRARGGPNRVDHGYVDSFLSVDFQQCTVQRTGHGELQLTPTEFRVLTQLVRHPNQLVSHAHLLESVWGDREGLYRDQVKLRISSLRRKLGQSQDDSCIETVRGFGYRYRPDCQP